MENRARRKRRDQTSPRCFRRVSSQFRRGACALVHRGKRMGAGLNTIADQFQASLQVISGSLMRQRIARWAAVLPKIASYEDELPAKIIS